ncbi:MAG: polysaccharide deacetylase family protein [Pseudomonadota bacterium]
MSVSWAPVRSAMRRHEAALGPLKIWWRDDDAIEATPALERLIRLSEHHLPVHLAIIPGLVKPSIVDAADAATVVPVVHGWRHENHQKTGKKSEYGFVRPETDTELRQGVERLSAMFGSRLFPMFVPPWNRVDASVLPLVADAGHTVLSTFGDQHLGNTNSLKVVNTHIDPIDWRGSRDLVDPEVLIKAIANSIADRIQNDGSGEPIGLLTHHLVHSGAIWQFTDALLAELLNCGAVPWEGSVTT